MLAKVALLLAAACVAVLAAPADSNGFSILLAPQSQNLGQQPLQQGYQYDQSSGQNSLQLPPQFQSMLQNYLQQQGSPGQQQMSPITNQQQASPVTMQQLQNGIQQYLQQQSSPITMQQIQSGIQQYLQQQSSPVTMQQLQNGIQQYLQWQQENPQQARQLIQQLQNMPGPSPIKALVQQLAMTLGEGVSQGADRLTNAIVKTFDFNYQNFDNTLNCMQGAGEKIVDSGINVLKSGLGIFLSIPRAVRNFAADPYADQNQNRNNRVLQRYQ